MTPEHPPDRLHQRRAWLHPLFAADPADRGAGDGGAGRAVRRRVWADPGARHGDVPALRAVLAAAGLDCAARRPAGADDAVLPRHRPLHGGDRVRRLADSAGDRARRDRAVRRDLPSDRHRHAGRRRRRQAGPRHRRERRVRQCGCGIGTGGDRVPRQPGRLAHRLPAAGPRLRRAGPCVAASAGARSHRATWRAAVSRNPAPSGAPRGDRAAADRDRLRLWCSTPSRCCCRS